MTNVHRRLTVAALLALTCIFAVGALVDRHVIPGWWAIAVWMWDFRATLLAIVAFVAALLVWGRGWTFSARWGKDLLVALIAALAVLVSGGVSAFVSWSTTTRTLEEQRQQSSRTYLRDSIKAAYSELLQKSSALGGAVDKVYRAAQGVRDGRLPQIQPDALAELEQKADDFSYALQPILILSPLDTAKLAVEVSQNSYKLLAQAKDVSPAGPANPADVREKARAFTDEMERTSLGGEPLVKLMESMRRDLGVSN